MGVEQGEGENLRLPRFARNDGWDLPNKLIANMERRRFLLGSQTFSLIIGGDDRLKEQGTQPSCLELQ